MHRNTSTFSWVAPISPDVLRIMVKPLGGLLYVDRNDTTFSVLTFDPLLAELHPGLLNASDGSAAFKLLPPKIHKPPPALRHAPPPHPAGTDDPRSPKPRRVKKPADEEGEEAPTPAAAAGEESSASPERAVRKPQAAAAAAAAARAERGKPRSKTEAEPGEDRKRRRTL